MNTGFWSVEHARNRKLLLYVVLLVLSVNATIYTEFAATNVLRQDAWRFLEIFYSKWLQGTLVFRDLFSDFHPKPVNAILFVANAEIFSLQMKYEALLGVVAKAMVGFLLLRALLHRVSVGSMDWLSVLFICFLMALFFGMNETVEYRWSLVAINNVGLVLGLAMLFVVDRYFRKDVATLYDSVTVLILIILFSLVDGTTARLFLAAMVFTLLPLLVLDKDRRFRIVLIMAIVLTGIAVSGLLYKLLGVKYRYSLSGDIIYTVFYNLDEYIRLFVYGLSAGIVDSSVIKFVLLHLHPAKYAILIGCASLVPVSVFLFYRKRLWSISMIPMVLVIYLLLFIIAAAIFRTDMTESRVWPLYVPRYITGYHFGWLGVISIYLLYFNQARKPSYARYIAGGLLLGGIAMQTNAAVTAWYNARDARNFADQAEKLLCAYADDNTVKLPGFVYGGRFSDYNVDFIKRHELNIFSDKAPGGKCY